MFTSYHQRLAFELDEFETEYQAMLYGGATTNKTTPHFTMSMAGTGIAVRADGGGRIVLYTDGSGCICEFPVRPGGRELTHV